MSIRNLFLFLFSILIALPVSAEIWIVDNTDHSEQFFTTIQAAHNDENIENGDTIYVHGSPDGYGNLTATKQLTWIGPGYFLEQNPNTQAKTLRASVGTITFNDGSDGSVFTGFSFSQLVPKANNLVISRNYGSRAEDATIKMNHNAEVSNILITQNYLRNSGGYYNEYYCIWIGANYENVSITNSILETVNDANASGIFMEGGAGPATIAYNTISISRNGRHAVNVRNSALHSNILSGAVSVNACNCSYNLTKGSELGNENGNVRNVNMANVFLGAGTTDGKWQLAEESPALGAGADDTDCGAYGGTNPYVLSGIPPIPTITVFRSPAAASGAQGLLLRTTIKSRN